MPDSIALVIIIALVFAGPWLARTAARHDIRNENLSKDEA